MTATTAQGPARATVPAMLCLVGAALALAAALHRPLHAQGQPADGRRYAVAYVEVQSTAVKAMRAAVDRYRSDSRLEDGFDALELLQQSGNPGLFVIVERWRDDASIAAHAKAGTTTRFRDALTPIRVSGYDERPYKDFEVSAPTAGAAAVHVVTHVDIGGPGDVSALLRRLAADSRAETGCLRFDILQHTQRANHFTIVEAWRTRADRDRHAAAGHTRQYREALQPSIGSPLDERLMVLTTASRP